MLKYSKNNLKKIEQILIDMGYTILYEKGTFKSGFCIVLDNKVVVINKFLQTEGRINTIIDIISSIDIKKDELTPASVKALLLITKPS